jgi:hypothetical protein
LHHLSHYSRNTKIFTRLEKEGEKTFIAPQSSQPLLCNFRQWIVSKLADVKRGRHDLGICFSWEISPDSFKPNAPTKIKMVAFQNQGHQKAISRLVSRGPDNLKGGS